MVDAEDIFPDHKGVDHDFRKRIDEYQRPEGLMIAKLVVPARASVNRSEVFFGVYFYCDRTIADEIERIITGHRVFQNTFGSANELCEVINKYRVVTGREELTFEKEVLTLKPPTE